MKANTLARTEKWIQTAVQKALKGSQCPHHLRWEYDRITPSCPFCDAEALRAVVKAYQESRVELCNDLDRALARITSLNKTNTDLQRFAIEHCDMRHAEELRKINEAQYA